MHKYINKCIKYYSTFYLHIREISFILFSDINQKENSLVLPHKEQISRPNLIMLDEQHFELIYIISLLNKICFSFFLTKNNFKKWVNRINTKALIPNMGKPRLAEKFACSLSVYVVTGSSPVQIQGAAQFWKNRMSHP